MALIVQFPGMSDCATPPVADLKEWLAGFISRFPFEDDIADQFQRGMLAGLIEAYEAAGFDLDDARYQAARRMARKMLEASCSM